MREKALETHRNMWTIYSALPAAVVSQQYTELLVSDSNNTWCTTLVTDKLTKIDRTTEEIQTIVLAAAAEPTSLAVERQLRQRNRTHCHVCYYISFFLSLFHEQLLSHSLFSVTLSLLTLSFGSL